MAKKSTFEAVVEEMSLHSTLTEDEVKESLMGVIDFLQDRAHKMLNSDPAVMNPETTQAAHQFLIVTEVVHSFGAALIACDEIEEEELPN